MTDQRTVSVEREIRAIEGVAEDLLASDMDGPAASLYMATGELKRLLAAHSEREPDGFLAAAVAHAHEVDHKKARVPEGSKRLGELWLTEGGELVCLGDPAEYEEDDPRCHNCDAMGCTTFSHVTARAYLDTPQEREETDDE